MLLTELKSVTIVHTDHTHTHIHLTALCLGLPGWAGTRKVKPIWILLKQETVSGSGISWAICKSAPRSRQITTPAPHRSVFYRPDALPAAQPTVSKHWRRHCSTVCNHYMKYTENTNVRVNTEETSMLKIVFLSPIFKIFWVSYNVVSYEIILKNSAHHRT